MRLGAGPRKYLRYTLAAAALFFILAGSYFKVFELYELKTYDLRCQIRGPRPVSDKVVLVDIWDDTVSQLGAWPFERANHAILIEALKSAGAKAVAFDILFSEPKEGDAEVAAAAHEARNVFFSTAFSEIKLKNGVNEADKEQSPLIPEYRESALGVGHVNPVADLDGAIRRVYPVIRWGDKECYPLSLVIAKELFGADLSHLPLDEDRSFIVNYAGRWESTFQHYSYVDIAVSYLAKQRGLKPRIDLDKLKDKVCFVGLTTIGSHDTKPIPIESVYPMVGMHANALNSVLMNDFIRRAGRAVNVFILLIFGIGVLVVSRSMKPMKALWATLLSAALFSALAVLLFNFAGLWIDFFYPVAMAVIIYASATLSRTIYEIRKREIIENELKIASQIQKSFLPAKVPEQKGLELAVYMKPAKAVGGDLYAFVPLKGDRLGVMLGDVSGKGTPAALFMAKTVSEFKFSARDRLNPSEVLVALNDSIAAEDTGGLFVTLSYVIFDTAAKKMLLSDGGHLPVVVAHANGEQELLSSEQGIPVGVSPGMPFSVMEKTLRKGDCLALYSDGVSEARNKKKEEYGMDALQKVILANNGLPAEGILKKAIADLNLFMGRADQHDDITLIVVKITDPA